MASTEPPPQPVKHKTCVLRVSIHCEGCKRKVNKILQSVPGVDNIVIERQNHRVVVTGDVSPATLVRKLVKSGKHADLWPENALNHSQRTEKLSSNKEVSVSGTEIKPPATKTETPAVEVAVSGKEIKSPVTKTETQTAEIPVSGKEIKPPANKTETPAVAPVNIGDRKVEEIGGKVAVEEKSEEKKPVTGSASDPASPPVVEKSEKMTGDNGGDGGGGGEEKKKKKKKKVKEGQNSNLNCMGEASSSVPPQQTTTRSTNQSPTRHLPRHPPYKYTEPYTHAPPPQPAPVYTVSYNTAHPPVNSYTASYYAAAPPQSHAYSHYGSVMAPPHPPSPSEYYESYTQQPVDSFEMFSDENPNGCVVM